MDKDYQLVIRFPIKAIDDIEARHLAQAIIQKADVNALNPICKLQQVYPDRPPKKVVLK